MIDLKSVDMFLLDMDGTIYLEDTLIDGAVEFLDECRKVGKKFIFLTNNSSKNRKVYQKKLANMGIHVFIDQVFTSGEATTIYLDRIQPNAKIFLLGNEFLTEEFKDAGFQLVVDRTEIPDFVVLGFDTTLTYEKVWMACDFIRAGSRFIATHPDINCPLKNGKYMPDTGAMLKMIESSTGIQATVIGKPNTELVAAICRKYAVDKEQLCMVGDRLYTDIKMGVDSGIRSVLVLSGETTHDDLRSTNLKPTLVINSIGDLINKL